MQKLLKPLQREKAVASYSIFTIVVVAIVSIWAFSDALKAKVVVAADGDYMTVKTNSDTVGELLDDIGIDVGENDSLSHELDESIENGMEIYVDAARPITVIIDGEAEVYETAAATVGDFLTEENIEIGQYDEVSVSSIQLIDENLELIIKRAFPVMLTDGLDEEEEIWVTNGTTVEEALEENELTLNKLDKVTPALSDQVKDDTTITITRVKEEEVVIEESIAFQTIEEKDSSMSKGQSKVIEAGKEGKAKKTYTVTYENGEEVARDLIAEEVIEKSLPKKVAIGTKETSAASAPSGGKTFRMEATAYGPDCKGCSGVTAYGINVATSPSPKVIAVDPRVIPLGTRVWVEGYGEAIAGDTGGAIKGNRIDVLVQSEAWAAKNWGRKMVTVKVLD